MKESPPQPSPARRVSLRDIAEAAGVCLMTVSLSLRDSPKISAATRKRIHKLAADLGYQPDPELSRLMKHLRLSRTAKGSTGIAVLDFYPSAQFTEIYYNRMIRQGMTTRAAELGFSLTTFHAADYHFNLKHILNVIRHRGIEGVLLLPSVVPLELDTAADWRDLSVVATSNSILTPRFHSVVPHQFANMMRLLDSMQQRGHRRICAIFDEFFDERTAHNFTAAVDWHRHGRRTLVVPGKLPPARKQRLVADWIAEHRPDMIFAQASDSVERALPLLKKTSRPKKIVGLGTETTFASYLDERPDLVGSAAMELLAGMIYYHETGIPAHPRTTMIDCEFHFEPATG